MDKKLVLANTLKRRIMNMELAPGAALDEVSLCEEFNLSRPPVRELLRQLAAEGYLQLEANKGARVSSMSHESLRNFYLASPLIYISTTQLAAVNSNKQDIDELKAIQNLFKEAIDKKDIEGRVYYNNQFHLKIGLIANNPYLMPSLERLLIDHARLGKIFYKHPTTDDMRKTLDAAVEHHDQIINAIEEHNVVLAEKIIRDHINLSRKRMSDFVVPEGVEVAITYDS